MYFRFVDAQKRIRCICLPRSPFAIPCLGSAPILDPRSRSRSGLLTQISNSDLGLGFSNRIVKSIRQFHQNRSRSIGIWSFRGYFDDMKHKVDPTDPTPINWGDKVGGEVNFPQYLVSWHTLRGVFAMESSPGLAHPGNPFFPDFEHVKSEK